MVPSPESLAETKIADVKLPDILNAILHSTENLTNRAIQCLITTSRIAQVILNFGIDIPI